MLCNLNFPQAYLIQWKFCIFISNSAALSNTLQYWDKESSAGTAAPPRGELDILDMEQLINIRDLNTPNMSWSACLHLHLLQINIKMYFVTSKLWHFHLINTPHMALYQYWKLFFNHNANEAHIQKNFTLNACKCLINTFVLTGILVEELWSKM